MEGQINLSDYDKEQMGYMLEPLPCPFCGMVLKDFPKFMIVQPVRSEEYLLEKLRAGRFLGSDNGYQVICIRCGAAGARGMTRLEAVSKWNHIADVVDANVIDKQLYCLGCSLKLRY